MSVPLTTEARMFLRDVDREARRREHIAAMAVTERRKFTWHAAVTELEEIMANRTVSPIKRADRIRARLSPLADIADGDKGFIVYPAKSTKRTLAVNVLHVGFSEHPLEHVKGQRCLVAAVSYVRVARSQDAMLRAMPAAVIGEHAIGRLYERSAMAASNVVDLALSVAGVSVLMANNAMQRFLNSDVTVDIGGGAYLSGTLRLGVTTSNLHDSGTSCDGGELVSAFLDFRTCLLGEMLIPAQRRQADAITRWVRSSKHADEALIEAIPVLSPRRDHISEQLEKVVLS